MDSREMYKLAYRLYRLESRVCEIRDRIHNADDFESTLHLMAKGGRYANAMLKLRFQLGYYDPFDIKHKANKSVHLAEKRCYASPLSEALAKVCYGMSAVNARRWQPGLWPKVLAEYRKSMPFRLFKPLAQIGG